MNLQLFYQVLTPLLSGISLIANIWVTYVYFTFKELQQHPSTILSWISLFEISMSHHSIALVVNTNMSIGKHGPHYMIQLISLFTISEATARNISCAINQMLFSGAVTGVLCYNTVMSVDLLITLRNPLIQGKARMKYYHLVSLVLVIMSMSFNVFANLSHPECEMDPIDYLYQVWNYGLLTFPYFCLLLTSLLSISYIIFKNKEDINAHTEKYLKRHMKYLAVNLFIWTTGILFYWGKKEDKGIFGSEEKKIFVLLNLILISASGAVQALMRNWEPVFWNCSKLLFNRKKHNITNSVISSESGSVFIRDRENEDMWNMPMSFIMQENMKSHTALCILTGLWESIRAADFSYNAEFNVINEIKVVKKKRVRFSSIRYKMPGLNFYSHPFFVVEEYCPIIFTRLRLLEGIGKDDFLKSLDPEKNKNTLNSVSSDLGGSGSLFIFSEDGQFAIKIVQKTERKMLVKDLLSDYLEHIERNCMSFLNRILGIFTIKIPGISPLNLILTQGLLKGNLIKFYDLKGSSQNRITENVDPSVFKGPYKDLDFLNEQEKFLLADETVAEITVQLMRDFKFLLLHEIMDYSLIVGIFRFHSEKCFKDINGEKWYRLGIIDYLGKYSLKRKAEYYIKKLRYGKKIRMCSVRKPLSYYKRMVSFVFKKVIAMRSLLENE